MRRMIMLLRCRHLGKDERGMALVEFAVTLPILIMLAIGGFQLMDAISAFRKVVSTVRTLADLTTQNTTLSASDADQILTASQQVMAPYTLTASVMRISQIKVLANGTSVVSWSRALNGAAYTPNAVVTVPAAMSTPNTYYIYSEIKYTYTPQLASTLIGSIPLQQSIFMSPRYSQFITCDNSQGNWSTCPTIPI